MKNFQTLLRLNQGTLLFELVTSNKSNILYSNKVIFTFLEKLTKLIGYKNINELFKSASIGDETYEDFNLVITQENDLILNKVKDRLKKFHNNSFPDNSNIQDALFEHLVSDISASITNQIAIKLVNRIFQTCEDIAIEKIIIDPKGMQSFSRFFDLLSNTARNLEIEVEFK